MAEKKTIKEEKNEEIKFKGKFIKAIGRRKTSRAQVRLYKDGRGLIVVNGLKINQYFSEGEATVAVQPLKLTGRLKDLNFSILAAGGGKHSQAEAVRHGLARVLVAFDKELRPGLKAKGWLTRDARKTERKKPGLKKARRAPQWSKR
ncbi:MAG: 30S ribosomal protein S9 [Patescibacteria group bacterium]|nr:30S ribosomal protein S9 [Patescibacteria group bacterium]